jgi:hypothetical protein
MQTNHSTGWQLEPDKIMRSTLKFIPVALMLVAALSTFAPGGAFAEMDACDDAQAACQSGCNTMYPDPSSQENYQCIYSCNAVWWCCEGGCAGSTVANIAWLPSANILSAYVIQTNESILQTQVSGPGFYFLATNAQGVIQPLQLAVGLWNGSHFLSTNTVTNVEFFAISKSLLSKYAPSNYAQAPWSDLGPATQNTNTSLWELTWTPSNNASSYILASDTPVTATNGVFSAMALAMPQLMAPQLAGPDILANGNFALTVAGPAASYCTVQTSSDLQAWSNSVIITNFGGQAQIIDASGMPKQKYFRAIAGE